jgi:hypothetical protein
VFTDKMTSPLMKAAKSRARVCPGLFLLLVGTVFLLGTAAAWGQGDSDPGVAGSLNPGSPLSGDGSGEFVVSTEPGRWGGGSHEAVENFDYAGLPGRLSNPSVRSLWRESLDLERRGHLLESSGRYERIIGAVPEESYTYWRLARNYWRLGENLSLDQKVERGRYFDLSEQWAGRGLELDSNCAACMLWKFVSMGRQATTRGLLTAAGDVREMDDLLRRGIQLAPRHRDNGGNMTMGNLYYAGSVFYRVVPEWWWLKWLVGVRGDKARSVDYARNAVALAPVRIDYRVELGATLLCIGLDRGDSAQVFEGQEVLRKARGLDDFLSTDQLDKLHAEVLIEFPERACGYSRDGFIDVEGLGKQVRPGG